MRAFLTYSLTDLIPLTQEVYLRLFVRHNKAVWPSHLLAVLIGFALLYRLRKGKKTFNRLFVGGLWIWVAWTFHLNLYSDLNWAASYFGIACLVQGVGLFISELLSDGYSGPEPRGTGVGILIFAFSLVIYPFIPVILGQSWFGIQVFGIAAAPTAMATVGYASTLEQHRSYLLVIPVIWCLVSGLTSLGLGLLWGAVPAVVAILGTPLVIYQGLAD